MLFLCFRNSITKNADGSIEIVTEEGYVFDAVKIDSNIKISYAGKDDNLSPVISRLEMTTGEDNIEIEVITKRLESGEYRYYYKKATETEYALKETSNSNTYKIEGLERNTTYDIKVEIELADGKVLEITQTVKTTSSINELPILTAKNTTFVQGETNWTNKSYLVTVRVNVEQDILALCTIQTSKDGVNWRNTEAQTVNKENDKVYARLVYGEKTSNEIYTEIKNIDTTLPTIKTQITSSNVTTKGFTASITAQDSLSGFSKIVWNYKKSDETEYTKITDEDKAINSSTAGQTTAVIKTKSFDNLETGTYKIYAEVYDVAGNKATVDNGWTTSNTATGIANGQTLNVRLFDGKNAGSHASLIIRDTVAPEVTISPNGQNVKGTDQTGADITVTVTATDGAGIGVETTQYAWSTSGTQEPDAASYTNFTSGTAFTEKRTSGTHYLWVKVIDYAGNRSTTQVSNVFTVYIPPVVSTQPTDVAVKQGETATFSVGVTNGNPSTNTYKWYYTNTNSNASGTEITSSTADATISGQTSLTLNLANIQTSWNGKYVYAEVSNGEYTVKSNPARVTVYYTHTISTQPTAKTVNENATATFTVAANGGNPSTYTYKWYYSDTNSNSNGTAIASSTLGTSNTGMTAATLSIANMKKEWNNKYVYAEVSNGQYTVKSNAVKVGVNDITAPTINTNIASSNVTTKSFDLSITATDSFSGLNKVIWYYKLSTEDTYQSVTDTFTAATTAQTSKTKSFTNMTAGTYNVYAEVYDASGNKATSNNINVQLTPMPAGTSNITFSSVTWSGGSASITISKNSGVDSSLQLQYQVGGTADNGWTTVAAGTNSVTVTSINHNTTVYARLWDGKNAGSHASRLVQDGTGPTVTVTVGAVTASRIEVTVSATDNETGMDTSPTYTYKYKKSTETEYITAGTSTGTSTGTSYTYENLDGDTTYDLKVEVSDKAGNTGSGEASGTTKNAESIAKPNQPNVVKGMIPIKWDGGNWVVCDENDPSWYDYVDQSTGIDGTSKWANMMLSDGKYKYGSVSVGQVVQESELGSMFVWIPRFAYSITSYYHFGDIGVSGDVHIAFLNNTTTYSTGTSLTYTYRETSYTKTIANSTGKGNLNEHPAFNYGGTTISGIWVAKFEASYISSNTAAYSGTYASSSNAKYTLKVLPNVSSWRSISLNDIFNKCLEMNYSSNATYYGISSSDSTIDPHMMKNSEWGAVAYLAQSSYGRNGNEVTINNYYDSGTYRTGMAGDKINASSSSSTTNTYNTAPGQLASTTGNITGIYDMSGGAHEYTAAYVNNGYVSSSGSRYTTEYGKALIDGASKYKDVYSPGSSDNSYNHYEANSSVFGDAVYETSDSYKDLNSWRHDYSSFPCGDYPFFTRGSNYAGGSGAGVFGFSAMYGNDFSSCGFRPVLVGL